MSEWRDIETAPVGKPVWVATEYDGYSAGFMLPCYRQTLHAPWKALYTLEVIDWVPTHWQPLPTPPQPNPIKQEMANE